LRETLAAARSPRSSEHPLHNRIKKKRAATARLVVGPSLPFKDLPERSWWQKNRLDALHVEPAHCAEDGLLHPALKDLAASVLVRLFFPHR
jgi:hypothetical protein